MTYTETNNTTTTGWARAFLDRVITARKAIERGRKLAEMKRDLAFSVTNSLANLDARRAHGGTPDAMRRVDDAIDAYNEVETGQRYQWARDTIRECETILDVARATGDPAIVLGADVVDCRMVLGMPVDDTVHELLISTATMYRALRSFVAWMNANEELLVVAA